MKLITDELDNCKMHIAINADLAFKKFSNALKKRLYVFNASINYTVYTNFSQILAEGVVKYLNIKQLKK
jgi:hypothetical protein